MNVRNEAIMLKPIQATPIPQPKYAEPLRLVEPLMTKSAAAKLLGVCPRTIDNLIAAGRLEVVKVGTAARIDPKDLRAFIDQAKRPAGGEQLPVDSALHL